jgi:hypothetical protein
VKSSFYLIYNRSLKRSSGDAALPLLPRLYVKIIHTLNFKQFQVLSSGKGYKTTLVSGLNQPIG